jgi:hypothetical protein
VTSDAFNSSEAQHQLADRPSAGRRADVEAFPIRPPVSEHRHEMALALISRAEFGRDAAEHGPLRTPPPSLTGFRCFGPED